MLHKAFAETDILLETTFLSSDPVILLITLDQSYRAVILMSTLHKVVYHSNKQHTTEYHASPVHRLCCYRCSDGPECKEPQW